MPVRQLLSIEELSRDQILQVLQVAEEMGEALASGQKSSLRTDRLIALLLFGPASRNETLFQAACIRLGAGLMAPREDGDQLAANPSDLQNYLGLLREYVDLVVLPLDRPNVVAVARAMHDVPLLNGAESEGSPLEVLNSCKAILKRAGRLARLKVAIEFRPSGFRSSEAFALAVSRFPENEITFVCADGEPSQGFLSRLGLAGGQVEIIKTPDQLGNVDVVFTDYEASKLPTARPGPLFLGHVGKVLAPGDQAGELEKAAVSLRMALIDWCLQ